MPFNVVKIKTRTELNTWMKSFAPEHVAEGVYLNLTYAMWDIFSKTKLAAEFKLYYVNQEQDNVVLSWKRDPKTKIPPAPNASLSTHLIIYANHGDKTYILTTHEDDGHVGLPGGHVDAADPAGMDESLEREIREEIGFRLTGNKKPELAFIRLYPQFPRLGGAFTNKDVWFAYKLRLPYAKLRQLCKRQIHGDGEVKQLVLMDIDSINPRDAWWMSDQIRNAVRPFARP